MPFADSQRHTTNKALFCSWAYSSTLGTRNTNVLENFGRLYGLGFTLEQLRRNLEDFRNRVIECARAAGQSKIETLVENDRNAR